jgi:cardiolipin synthase
METTAQSTQHSLELLEGGAQYFPALIAAIDAATREVWLETYIFQFDPQGLAVAYALERAASRGVRVSVVVDGVGTPTIPVEWQQRWTHSGVHWQQFAPLGRLGLLLPGQWRRMHRKLCVVDGQCAFCGGINIQDDWLDPRHGPLNVARLDYAVKLRGPLVTECLQAMQQLWIRTQVVRDLEQLQWREARRQWVAWKWRPAPAAPSRAALVLRDNVRNRNRIERSYLKAIGGAKCEVVLANAYFLPGARIRRALMHAAQRGVRVQVVVQGRYEYFMQYHASRPVLGDLVRAGVEIHEYTPGYLHAKVAVVDGMWATVGSSNLDPLSLLLAREANVVVYDMAFAQRLCATLKAVIASYTRRWDLAADAKRPWQQRLRDRIAFALMRMLIFFSGRRY